MTMTFGKEIAVEPLGSQRFGACARFTSNLWTAIFFHNVINFSSEDSCLKAALGL